MFNQYTCTMYIYQIKHLKSEKLYIGSTSNFNSRKSKHFADLRKDRHHSFLLQRAYNKYGKQEFDMSIIEEVDADSQLIREQYYLDTLKPFYNILKKVNTFATPTREGKERIAEARRRKITQYTLNGDFIRNWNSITEASKALNIHEGSISWMCKGRYKQVGGFIFKYQDMEYQYDPAYKKMDSKQRSLNHGTGASKTYLIEKVNGTKTIVTNLLEFCKNNSINYNSLCSSISRFGKYKGMKITMIKGRQKLNEQHTEIPQTQSLQELTCRNLK